MAWSMRRCFVGAFLTWWLPAAGFAEEAAVAWRSTGVLAAPEAIQGAAADDQFVYAITNGAVAKYARAAGARVAVSTGPATHLNSGFFWKGRLYCAHSNYPHTPEQSQIKVLDVATMRLATEHDFGDVGGSLTWVVRHDGRWWCNFARYGDDNAQTFLIQCDDAFREQARWTYPPALIAQLGRYSLSGGVWRNGELYVTGHDDPVLFRLRVPSSGGVLELVERQTAPFTGQGIAADPVTGGLVGIDRARRQVVFAAADRPQPVRLNALSYNIHHGEGVDGQLDLERIARVVDSVDADLVSLQEVDQRATRSQSVDQPAALARLTGLRVVYGDNIPLQGGLYGNAVLSRWPIARHGNQRLPNIDRGEQRGVLEAEIALPGWPAPLLFLATHFDHRPNDRERRESAAAVNALVARRPLQPALLAGDLNDVPTSPTLQELGRQWTRANAEIQPTIPVAKPVQQIDYVLFRPPERWRVIRTQVLDEAVASDHRAVLAVVELLPAE